MAPSTLPSRVRPQARTEASRAIGFIESLADPTLPASSLLATVVAEADVVWRVRECHRCLGAGQESFDVLGLGGVAAEEPMLAQGPEIAGV